MVKLGDNVYVCNGWLVKLSIENAEVQWKYPILGGYYRCPVVAHDDRLYLLGIIEDETGTWRNGLAALSDDGRELWKTTLPGSTVNPVKIDMMDGNLYLSAGKSVLAIDSASGVPVWETSFDAEALPPSVEDNVVISSDHDGFVYGLNRSDGSVLWKVRVDEPQVNGSKKSRPIGRPFLYRGNVLLGHHDGTLTALNLDGEELWSLQLVGALHGSGVSLTADGDAIFLATWPVDLESSGLFYKILLPQQE